MATKTANCNSISQAEIKSWNGEIEALEYSDSEFQMWREGGRVDSAIIKFTTPSFTGFSKTVDIILGAYGNPNMTSPACYALCSSDQNVSLYADSTSVVNDPNQLAVGTVYIESYSDIGLSVKTNKLESEKEYYLFIWFPSDFDSDTWDARIKNTSYHTIVINYAQEAFIYDSSQGVYVPYQCYIDTEYAEYPEASSECEIIGQRYCFGHMNMSGTVYTPEDYSSTNESIWGSGTRGDVDVGTPYYSYHMKFKTPNVDTSIKNITFNIMMNGLLKSDESGTNRQMHYALCTSDANYRLYAMTYEAVTNDTYQITSGMFTDLFNVGDISVISIDNVQLSPNTEYYLIAWDTTFDGSPTYIKPANNHTVIITYEDKGSPVNKSKFELYVPYIDNGTTWEEF